MNMIVEATIFLVAALLVVPVFRLLRLGDVLGYLTAGLLIGPSVLGLISNAKDILRFAEIGVVFLLFVIGLELQPARLRVFRRLMFGLGSLQLLLTMGAFAGLGKLAGLPWPAAIAVGGALALSSTAFVLQILSDKGELMTPQGRAAFGVLLLQDIAVIPLLALISILGAREAFRFGADEAIELGLVLAGLVAAIVIGRYLLRNLLGYVVSLENKEIFLTAALLLVLGSGLVFEAIGLSMGLGAFTAGVLMSESEFRHQLEADIEPFKGLLLGLFFIAVGMSANLSILMDAPLQVIGLTICLVVGKFLLLLPLGYLFGLRDIGLKRFAILLAQGGEFAFVLFTPAFASGLLDQRAYDLLVLAVTMSMICTPLLLIWQERRTPPATEPSAADDYDSVEDVNPRVLIAGFGRVGQIIGRILNSRGIPFVAIDVNPDRVKFVRRFGNEVYFGDATREDLLRSAGLDEADIFVNAIGDVEVSLKVTELVREVFPHVKLYARARNRQHSMALRAMGVTDQLRDTLLSSLALSESILVGAGLEREVARETVEIFRQHDSELLDHQYAIRDDEEAVVQHARKSAEQLKFLFEQDLDR